MKLKISETARKNHDQLWPDYQSEFAKTDPELIAIFDNFAFDEVIQHSKMDTKTRLIVIMASTIGSQSLTEFEMMLYAALNVGVSPVEIKEVVYQSVPYCGINKVIDFLKTTNEIFKEKNIALPLEGQAVTTSEDHFEKGLAVQKKIVGAETVDKMRQKSAKDVVHFQDFLALNCFGDYVSRKGLSPQIRELVTLSILIALGGVEPQMKGHIAANANVGNDRNTLIDLVTQLLPYVGYPRTLNALNCVNEILPPKE